MDGAPVIPWPYKDSELFMNDLFNLSGKKALITGCNKGIGRSMALGLAEAGADIIGVSATIELEGSSIGKDVEALGRRFKSYQQGGPVCLSRQGEGGEPCHRYPDQ